jgi:hypothetical protein
MTHTSPFAVEPSTPGSSIGAASPDRGERAYRSWTIAAMLLLLGSLWLFW